MNFIEKVFREVDKFFSSLNEYISVNYIFITFLSLFILTVIFVIVTTSKAYEARLIHAVDMFNKYFIDNPKINNDNLIAFNDKMKSKKVPKQLRKQWQSFVLYRDKAASQYMSFDNCITIPIKNSTFKRDILIMNILAYLFSTMALILNLYCLPEQKELQVLLQQVLLCPALILTLNFIITIFLNIRHNAIVSDLYQNYQYFEVNIDKATQTLPEYVDYEVLFDKNEIKKGIPILYAYLQKRAEEEQKQLERARLKNVEHEKFNFDETGVESSLVLDRAMQEAENYISERKKLTDDIKAINESIDSENLNFREITKEHQRQMQVSKESFDNFKAQEKDANSSIEQNYLKKQQQQELDHQRELEKKYDKATNDHNKSIESLEELLSKQEAEIANLKSILETTMMSEFNSYSSKVYDAAKKEVEIKQNEKVEKLRSTIKQLEEQLLLRDQNANNYNMQANAFNDNFVANHQMPTQPEQPNVSEPSQYENYESENNQQEYQDYNKQNQDDYYQDEQYSDESQEQNLQEQNYVNPQEQYDGQNYQADNNQEYVDENNYEDLYSEEDYNQAVNAGNEQNNQNEVYSEDYQQAGENVEDQEEYNDEYEDEYEDQYEDEYDNSEDSTVQENESIVPRRKAGRPRKVVTDEVINQVKRGRGRPRKEETEVKSAPVKKGRGRPRKVEPALKPTNVPSKGRGRPRKDSGKPSGQGMIAPSKGRGRPRKMVSAPKTTEASSKGRGRPRKDASGKANDIESFLKEIDREIAKENQIVEKSKKAIENKANRISNGNPKR